MNSYLRNSVLILFILFTISSCSTKQVPIEPEITYDYSIGGPFVSAVTYTGVIPCDHCEQVDITLNLLPNSMYQLRKIFRIKGSSPKIESQIGKWVYLPKDNLLILGKQRGLLKTYVVENNNKLLFVEWEGTGNASQIQYELVRSAEIDPFEDVVKFKGIFGVVNSVGTIKECSTEQNFDVRGGKEFSTLLQNYMNTPHIRGRSLLVSIAGKIVQGENNQPEVLVEQFRKISPDRNCQGDKIKSSLTGTFWRLFEIDGMEVTKSTDGKSTHLILDSDRSFTAYAGCNKITGSYLIKGDNFLLKRKPNIRLACPGGISLESKLIKALDSSEWIRVEDGILELMDETDQVRARFHSST